MERIASAILQHKKFVVTLFLAAAVLCTLLQFTVSVNYNMVDYLPAEAQSTKALSLMEQEFDQAVPNARALLHDVTLQEAIEYKNRLAALEGVSGALWLDDVIDLKQPIETADPDTVSSYYKDGDALLSLTIREGDEAATVDRIYAVIGEENALSGEAVNMATSQKMAVSESLNAILILVPLILLILLLSTNSWIEPLFFLLAIGVSVLINLCANVFLGEVSFVTQSVSPILQLAVSLDYAIFLLHSFAECRAQTDDTVVAMRLAMKKSFPAVAASAATTLFGFVALTFMHFGIGVDLGLNLVKGIVLSFVSVMVFLPALTLCLYRWIDKTQHRRLLPSFKGIGRAVAKCKIPCLILVALLLVPCFLAQGRNNFTYGYGALGTESRSGRDTVEINERFGASTAIVLLAPKGDAAREELLCDALASLDHVDQVVSYVTMVGSAIPEEYLDQSVTGQFYSEQYCRIILYTDTPEEGDLAFAVVEQVQETAEAYYDEVYSCGQSVNLYDMKNTVTQDNQLVNWIAIAAIALVLLCAFRSLTLPVILLLTIETAIWINLSVPYFTGSALCYIGYLVINTVQLGATVDYAILLTDAYQGNRKSQPPKPALHRTLGETFSSILISSSILSLAGFVLWLTSSNSIVSELGLLLGRGTLLSMALVVCFLPAMLQLLDKIIAKTTRRAEFYKER